MKKSLVSLLLVVSLLFSMLAMASCSQPMPDFEMPEEGFNTENPVTIVFYHTMGQNLQNELNSALKRFKTLYPNITVDHKQIGGYDDVRDQISTELHAGTQPNLAYCYPDHIALYNTSGGVVTLDQFIDHATLGLTADQKADFYEKYWEEGKAFGDDKMYSLPLSKSTELLFYNADFFAEHDEAGCCAVDHKPLYVPQTWEQLEEVCAEIKKIDPNSVPLGYDSEANWFITLCEQYGYPYTSLEEGNHFQFNTDDHVDFVEMIRGWYKKGYVTTQEITGTYTSNLFTETDPAKLKCYMSIGSSGGTAHQAPTADGDGEYPFEVGIAGIPQADPDHPKAISQGPSLCILQNKDPQEVIASWLLIRFLTTDVAFQADFSKASGYVPVIKSARFDPYYESFLETANGTTGITALGATVSLATADSCFTSPAFNGSTVAREQVGLKLTTCMTADWADSEVRAKILEELNKAIAICKARS
ncbi:MAG: extracellular solute-binding protein [Clostridia bacterium]|nr:extracellular solute-binding protein [Clostridia bacterium]